MANACDVLRITCHEAAISALTETGSRSQDDVMESMELFAGPLHVTAFVPLSSPYQRHPETCILKTSIGVADVVQGVWRFGDAVGFPDGLHPGAGRL